MTNGDLSAKETVKILGKYNKEIIGLVKDVNDTCKTIEKERELLEKERGTYKKIKLFFSIGAPVILLFIIIFTKNINITFGDLSIKKGCLLQKINKN